MPKNDIYIMQRYFFEYIKAQSVGEKKAIIEDCKEEVPSSILMIDRLKNAIDGLNEAKETKIIFINKVFDIKNNVINIELLENIEDQIRHKTIVVPVVKKEMFNITQYKEFEKLNSFEEIEIIGQNDIKFEKNDYYLNEIENNNSKKMNYLIRSILGFKDEELLFAEKDGKNYIISKNKLPDTSTKEVRKEDCLCDKKTIWLNLENEFNNVDEQKKNEFLKMIFLDVITNQNFRILRNGTGVLESDDKQNDYYVLNGKTLKKDYLIESLFENYYDVISDIANLINDNYEDILNLIDDLLKNNDETYFNFVKENINRVYKQRNLKIGLQKITENYKENYSEYRITNNEQFKYDLDILKKSLGLKEQVLTKTGYASILTIVLGIIACGFAIAYLMLAK